MKTSRQLRGLTVWLCVMSVVVGLAANASAAIVYADDIYLAYANRDVTGGAIYWYNGGQPELSFTLSDLYPLDSAELKVQGAAVYDYGIEGHVTVLSELDHDASSGGQAIGHFLGEGVTFQVEGKFWNETLYTDWASDPDRYEGVILKGTMALSAGETWIITENVYTHDFTGSVEMNPDTSVGLGLGIPIAGGDTLKIGYYATHFTFRKCNDVPGFADDHIYTRALFPGGPSLATVQITALPEPVSLVLLATGSLFLCVSRKGRKRN